MAHRRRGFPVRSRRATDWGFGPDADSVVVTSSTKTLWTTALTIGAPYTLIRLRGHFELILTVSSAIGAGFAGAIGMTLVSNDAFAAGAGSIPGPVTDSNWDGWFYHQFFNLHATTATVADAVNNMVVRKEIDSKAMRKWTPDQTLVAMIGATQTGNASMTLHADSRVLVKSG